MSVVINYTVRNWKQKGLETDHECREKNTLLHTINV